MPSQSALGAALAAVEDPVLGRSLGSLDMIRSVKTRRFGSPTVTVALPVPNYPVLADLVERLRTAASGLVSDLDVRTEVMNDPERAEMMARIRDDAGPGPGETGSPTRVVAISSGKGGVGKSSVATNLGLALRELGKTVGLIDADIWGFSIPKMLGIDRAPVVIEQSIIPPSAHGVNAMSMDYFVPDDRAVIWRGPMLHKALEQFLKDVFWDSPDYLLIDMPPGTGDIAISIQNFLPRSQVLLVTTPQPTAQRVARRAALMAAQVNQEVIGVVENMSWFTGDDGKRYELFGSGGGQALASELGVPLMARIPLLPLMREGADRGIPVMVAAADSEASQAFAQLAAAVEKARPRIRSHPELVIR
ncbi:MAG: Mrp/NBP35 family ATP-binding protein [bacterium]|nr:Mrp/NBP35 family ATP-binding protein [Acidimicrobiia bacterium]MCY4649978.1 Mrp/NBP35 family ATP-binding protein [bacterium]